MKITIETTSKIVEVNGVPARIWEGHTESGIPVHCYVTRTAVHRDEDASQFERELEAQRAPSADVAAIPLRLIVVNNQPKEPTYDYSREHLRKRHRQEPHHHQ